MDVNAAVRQLLLEHGAYSPVELLLAANQLPDEDYLAWRRGERVTLDEAWAASADEIQALLEEAEACAQALGLIADPMVHLGCEENAGTELVASRNPSLNALLGNRYCRSREQEGQLDLFVDNDQTIAMNALRDALRTRDAGQAKQALEQLASLHPGYRDREQAAALIAALETPSPDGTEQGFAQLERLEREWLPAASNLLGAAGSRDFLDPLWRGIGEALMPAAFDPQRPKRHASWAYRQCLDWERLKRSVLAVPEYAAEPALLARLAEAEWQLHERPKAIAHWFALCWQAPNEFEALVEAPGFPDLPIKRAWHSMREQDLKPELTPAWFPAWMLIEESGLARVIGIEGGETGPKRAFDILIALMAQADRNQPNISLRGELQALHPELLARYLAQFA